jgi:geranylgeranyl pyrophosphate synthase
VSSGKRAGLTLCVYLLCYSGLLASQRQVAMIAEMIHSASLIHDDVVDQADLRRGKPSVNVLWNHKKVRKAIIVPAPFPRSTLFSFPFTFVIS